MRFQLDPSYRRFDSTVIGGTPLRLFRASPRGVDQLEALERGDAIEVSALSDALLRAGAIAPIPAARTPLESRQVTLLTPTNRGTHPSAYSSRVPHVIVDDGANPPIAEATIRLDRNQGPAAARNAGLRLVTTDIVVLFDDDVVGAAPYPSEGRAPREALKRPVHGPTSPHAVNEPDAAWWEPLLNYFDDPTVAAVAPRVRSLPSDDALGSYEFQHGPLDLGPHPALVRPGGRVPYVPSAALVARVSALTAVGGFDPELRTGEDVDLVWRLHAAGWKVWYDPRVVVAHQPRSSWRSWALQRIGYGACAAKLDARHRGDVAPAAVGASSAVAAWLLVAKRPGWTIAVTTMTSAALVPRLTGVPAATAWRIGMAGHIAAFRGLLGASRRVWWPLLALTAVWSPSARRVLIASIAEGCWRRVVDTSPTIDTSSHLGRSRQIVRLLRRAASCRSVSAARTSAIGLADDAFYGMGVWKGALTERRVGPLLPRLIPPGVVANWARRQWRGAVGR